MHKNTDFANNDRKVFIAKNSARTRRKTDLKPVLWPYYTASAALMLSGIYVMYLAYR